MKYIGLMFQKKPQALVFRFPMYTKSCIHSYFCKPFLAIWIKNKKIINYKVVAKGIKKIPPLSSYDTLIEIPISLLQN